jgi:hypothetical protein
MPKLNKGVELAETPKPFLGVCICGRCLCHNKGVELAKTPKPFLGVCVCGCCLCHDEGLSWLKCPSPFWVFAFAAFCVTLLPPRLLVTTFGIVAPINLRLMVAMGIPPGDVVIALTFKEAVAVAASLQHRSVAWRELGLDKLCEY